jgi:hypothetical protein
MKSERRNEPTIKPKTQLASEPLETPGDYWRVYGNRILLVVIAMLAIFLAVRYYNEKKATEAAEISSSLEIVRAQMGNLQQVLLSESRTAGAETIQTREHVVSQLSDAISSVLNTAKDPKLIARGYLAKGDMNWDLANAADPAGSTTRPELKVQNRDGLLDEARDAYSRVLEAPFSDDPLNLFTARMGLAAIAENQHKWDVAKAQYQAIADSSLPASFKELARKRVTELPDLQKQPILNPAPELGDLASLLANMSKTQPGATMPAPTMPDMTMPPTSMPTTSMPAMTSEFKGSLVTMPSASAPAATQPATSQP